MYSLVGMILSLVTPMIRTAIVSAIPHEVGESNYYIDRYHIYICGGYYSVLTLLIVIYYYALKYFLFNFC